MSLQETQQEIVQSSQTQSGATLKLLRNKTHIGPTSGGKATLASLSKAAGKIAFDSNLKITVKDTDAEVGKTKDPTKRPEVALIDLGTGNEAEQATYWMLAWDKAYNSVGTDNYQVKYQEFAQAQAATYAELGLTVKPTDKKPELTEQQRRMYNDRMRKFAFSYYEYRLSFKQPGKKAVRTLTYRTLKPMDLDKVIAKLRRHYEYLSSKLSIKVR